MLNVYRNTVNGTDGGLLPSRDPQRPLHGFGFAADHGQEGACRPDGNESTLLPVAKRLDVETKAVGELLLGETEAATDRFYVDFRRDVDDKLALVGGAVGKRKRLIKPPDYAFAMLAHDADLSLAVTPRFPASVRRTSCLPAREHKGLSRPRTFLRFRHVG